MKYDINDDEVRVENIRERYFQGKMKLHQMCYKSTSFDREDAGWYVPNSVYVRDIRPEWRLSGGGVLKENLTQSLHEAYDKSIELAKQRIHDAEHHIKLLENARDKYLNNPH